MAKSPKSSRFVILLVIGLIVCVVGLKLTSIAQGPYNIQDDGYNVTGGFIAILGGALLGYWFAKRGK